MLVYNEHLLYNVHINQTFGKELWHSSTYVIQITYANIYRKMENSNVTFHTAEHKNLEQIKPEQYRIRETSTRESTNKCVCVCEWVCVCVCKSRFIRIGKYLTVITFTSFRFSVCSSWQYCGHTSSCFYCKLSLSVLLVFGSK